MQAVRADNIILKQLAAGSQRPVNHASPFHIFLFQSRLFILFLLEGGVALFMSVGS